MRSGLLAVGLILLVLGIIFYYTPTVSASNTDSTTTTTDNAYVGDQQGVQTTQRTDVQTTKYATADATIGTTGTSGTTGTTTGTTDTTTTTSDNTVTTGTSPSPTTTVTTEPTTTTTTTGFFTRLFGPRSTTTTTTSAGYSNLPMQQQLSIIAMILGAVLTILGLVLPDARHTHVTTARTSGAPARRVYEEEEIRRRP